MGYLKRNCPKNSRNQYPCSNLEEAMPDIKVGGNLKDYYNLLNKRLEYLHKLLQDFKSKKLAMINKDRALFQ